MVQDWGPVVKGRRGLRLVLSEGCEVGDGERRLNPMNLVAVSAVGLKVHFRRRIDCAWGHDDSYGIENRMKSVVAAQVPSIFGL